MTEKTLIDKELDELYNDVDKGKTLGRNRRIVAYAMKLIAGGAGLLVATGKFTAFDQALGIAVLIVVFLDSVFSNHVRLISEAQAGHAYKELSRKVKATYNSKLNQVLQAGNADSAEGKTKINELKTEAHKMLSGGIADIEKKLSETDIKALKALSLEAETNSRPS